MKDLSSSFKDITEEIKEYAWYKERPYSEADWKKVKHYLFYTKNETYLLVGYLRDDIADTSYAVYIIECSLEDIKNEEIYRDIVEIAERHIKDRTLYSTQGRGNPNRIGTYGLVENDMVTIGYISSFSFHNWEIRNIISSANSKSAYYSEMFNWREFSKQMDDIDKEAKNFRWGMDPYVNLSKYLPMRDMDLTFMALSNDEFAKTQYMRYIRHLHSEIQAQGALR